MVWYLSHICVPYSRSDYCNRGGILKLDSTRIMAGFPLCWDEIGLALIMKGGAQVMGSIAGLERNGAIALYLE